MSVVASLLHSLRFLVRSRAALHLEIVALRHQLVVTSRSRRPRLRWTALDRALWGWLSHRWRGWRSALHVVQPATVLAWHRRGFRLFWTWKSRHRIGRPVVSPDVRTLIREMSTTNPLWGAPRLHGELLKLGVSVSQSAVATICDYATPSASTVTTVADLPHQSREPDHGRRPLRRTEAA